MLLFIYFAVLRQLRNIWQSVSDPVLQTLVVALVLTQLKYGSATLSGLPAVQLDRLQSVLNAAAWLIYWRQKFDHVLPLLKELHWLRVPECLPTARTANLPVGSSCLPMSTQHGTALPHRPAPPDEQCSLLAVSTLVIVGYARCSSHRTRDHRWPCIQFNCSSCMEQFANGSAVFWVTGHFWRCLKLNCSRILTTDTAPVKRLVSHCRILFPDKSEWQLISATLCGWRRCFVADQLWLMTRIREEEDCCVTHSHFPRSFFLWLQPWSLLIIMLLWHSFLIKIIIIIIIKVDLEEAIICGTKYDTPMIQGIKIIGKL